MISPRFYLFGLLALLFIGAACQSPTTVSLQRYEFEQPEMGVPFRMILYAPSREDAVQAAVKAFDRVFELNQIFSDYEANSETSRLSASAGRGQALPVSTELWKLLDQSIAFSKQTSGAFDVTVGPLVTIWKKARRERKLPTDAAVQEALSRVGYGKIKMDKASRSVELTVPGMRLDFGAIAKGYVVQKALETVQKEGIKVALMSAGGDMAMGEPPPGKKGWKIELDAGNGRKTFLSVKNRTLSTAGDTFQFLELEGKRYSHIIDPRTGWPVTEPIFVTTIGPDGATTDALDTVISVLGAKEGLKLIRRYPGSDARILMNMTSNPSLIVSKGFMKYYQERGKGEQ